MERHDDNALVVYTDGSCLSRPRRGGWAYRLIWINPDGSESIYDHHEAGLVAATNNRMELTACVAALKHVTGRHSPIPPDAWEKIVVYADSAYVVDNVFNASVHWPRTKWMTSEGEPVANRDLWLDLVKLRQKARVEIRKVKAHKTNPHNRAVDKLAKASARMATQPMPGAPMVARKQSPRKTEPHSVAHDGRTETIRVVVVRDLPRQRYHAYKYEVIDPESASYLAVDDAFAVDGEVELRRNHAYEVRLSDGARGRWIEEVMREVPR